MPDLVGEKSKRARLRRRNEPVLPLSVCAQTRAEGWRRPFWVRSHPSHRDTLLREEAK